MQKSTTKESVRKHIIKMIEADGLPVGFIRDEADSYWGIRVNADRTVKAVGYAKEATKMTKVFTIDDLPLLDLVYLIDDDFVMRDKKLNDWNWDED